MRKVDTQIANRFKSNLQTKANNANPAAVVWINRPTTALTDSDFMEFSAPGVSATACDIAIRRAQRGEEPDRAYIAYISNGTAGVKSSALTPAIDDMVWTSETFSQAASDVAIAFNARMISTAGGASEFATEDRPWVFWVNNGVLKGRILGLLGETELATANCTKVTAIRATGGAQDFGLVVFFLLNGSIYYRQLINGEWTDAAPVTFGPSVTWVDIAAFRTWDYRTGIQGIDTNGNVYELFTQFQGIARHGSEHIELDATAKGSLTTIRYHDAATDEHISFSVASVAPYGGLYRIGVPNITAAENVADGADWGRTALFTFDRHLRADEVAAQPTAFHIVDAYDRHFVAQTATLQPDGLTVRLSFLNFNGALGACTAQYVPGTVRSMADYALEAASFPFTPRNLVPPSVPAPAPVSVENDGDDTIIVTFDRALIGSLSGAASHFTALLSVPEYSPGGETHQETRTPVSAAASGSDTVILTFASGNLTDLTKAHGAITLVYDGAGPLAGEGGPVYPFSETFAPDGLSPKYDQNDAEHIELDVSALGVLTRIYHTAAQNAEHVAFTVAASGTLTHVNDL